MTEPAAFLTSLAHALAVMTLYPEGHPSREGAVDEAYQRLDGLAKTSHRPSFTFLDGEVIFGQQPIRDLKNWDWASRLIEAGIQRLELERKITRDEFDGFLQEMLARLTLSTIDTGDSRQLRGVGIRFGAVGLQEQQPRDAALEAGLIALDLSFEEEVQTLQWLQDEVQERGAVPVLEAEALVQSLSVAMRGQERLVLPQLMLEEFDQYTTTHSLNVAVLAMGLAEHLGCTAAEVRALGIAGLLHDIGKIRLPIEVLTKPGQLTESERLLINRHPEEGARILMRSHASLDLAAVVAYEHHIMLNGGGYPKPHYGRPCARASRLVHVCDVFDALRTKRPYRDAWPVEDVIAHLRDGAGRQFDPDMVAAFVELVRQGDLRTCGLDVWPSEK